MSVGVVEVTELAKSEEALRRSEAGLRLALEAGEMGSFEWDIRTGELRWSENLETIHGLPAGSFGRTFDAFKGLIHPDDRERVLGAIGHSLETGSDYESEFRSAGSDGEEPRWMLGKGKVLVDEGGRPCRMIGVCMDITRRKRAEQATQEANRRKDEFIAMVSHELRNPLAAIMNQAALLDRITAGDDLSARACAAIRRQAQQLASIVDDLLDVSRLAAGKLTLERTTQDLAALVERCVQDFVGRRLLDEHRRELRLSPAYVSGDGPRLEQVVSNLLTNALKYTPRGGRITVTVDRQGGDAVLRVSDSGIGIAPELMPRIFDLFVQSDRGLDRRDGGLGLGLSIVRRLVEAHGGRIEARSAGPNQGSEFIVRLPGAVALPAPGQAPGAGAEAVPRKRILVIDDNEDAREALVGLLEHAGHEVHQAAEGVAGVESASQVCPDVAIVDIGLPGLDGFEVARQLKARISNLRLIALTGYGQFRDRTRGAEVGFDAYLVKPIEIDAILDTIASR